MQKRSRKQEVIETVFQRVLETCPPDSLVFDNDLVKQVSGTRFSNQFDATKFDVSEKLPQSLRARDYFIVHLGGGRHQFVKGVSTGYHQLEPIPAGQTVQWPYRKGVLDDVVTSHGFFQLLNYRLLQDFLCDDATTTPNLFYPRCTRVSFVHQVLGQTLEACNLPIHVQGALEYRGRITVCHFVPDNARDYAIYRFFPQYSYFCNLAVAKGASHGDVDVVCVTISRKKRDPMVSLRRYAFATADAPASIRVVKCARYVVVGDQEKWMQWRSPLSANLKYPS